MGKVRTIGKVFTAAGALLVVSMGFLYYQNSQAPNLGVKDGKLKPLNPKPNGVSTQADDPERKVETLGFKKDTDSTMAALKQALDIYGHHTVQAETDNYLYVVFTTPVMKFRDDGEFWLDEDAGEIHFRAQARAGYSDLDMNRKRYQRLGEIYEAIQ